MFNAARKKSATVRDEERQDIYCKLKWLVCITVVKCTAMYCDGTGAGAGCGVHGQY